MGITNLLLSGVATLTDPVLTDGQAAALGLNADGRLRVSSKPGQFPIVTGALTTSAQTLPVDVTDASNVILHLKNTGSASMSAGAFVFEGSSDSTDGTDGTWFTVQAVRSDSNTIETGRGTSSLAAGAAQAYAWELSVNAYRWFRIRCSTTLTTNAIATWSIVRGSYATEPVPAVPTHAVTGSGTFTISPTSGTGYALVTAATTNAALVASGLKQLTELSIANLTAATIYVKLYNKASAPTVGTDVPIITIPVLANEFKQLEFGVIGKRFSLGIALAVTAAAVATDTTVVAAGAQISASLI